MNEKKSVALDTPVKENGHPPEQKRVGGKGSAWTKAKVSQVQTPEDSKPKMGRSILQELGYNCFSKFTQIEDAPVLWQEAAESLAAYASEVGRPSLIPRIITWHSPPLYKRTALEIYRISLQKPPIMQLPQQFTTHCAHMTVSAASHT